MKIRTSILLAGVLGLVSAAQAQETSPAPSVPNPANPYPLNPVASDGTPLPRYNGVAGAGIYSGRSAYIVPGAGLVGTGVDTGLGLVGTGVDAGLGVAGDALDTGLGAVGGVVR